MNTPHHLTQNLRRTTICVYNFASEELVPGSDATRPYNACFSLRPSDGGAATNAAAPMDVDAAAAAPARPSNGRSYVDSRALLPGV